MPPFFRESISPVGRELSQAERREKQIEEKLVKEYEGYPLCKKTESRMNIKIKRLVNLIHLLLLKYFNETEKYTSKNNDGEITPDGVKVKEIEELLNDTERLKKEIIEYITTDLYNKDPGYDKFNKIFYIAMNDIDVDKFKEYKLTNTLAGTPKNFLKYTEIAPQSKPGFFEYRDYWESLEPEDQLNYYNIYHLNASGKCDIIVDPYIFAVKHKKFVKDINDILEKQITINFNEDIDTVINNTIIIKTFKIKDVARKKKSCEERHEDEKENYKRIREALANLGPITINETKEQLTKSITLDCEKPRNTRAVTSESPANTTESEEKEMANEEDEKNNEEGGGRFVKKRKTQKRKTKKQKRKTKTRKTKRKRRY
jgi:hypothetical protein